MESAAASEGEQLRWPQLFSRVGLMRGSPVGFDGTDSAQRDLLWNLQAGIDVSPVRMHAANLIEARARADCQRQTAELAFRALASGTPLDETAAVSARAAALRVRLPEAERILAERSAQLEAARVSAPAHAATRRRVDRLRRAVADAEFELAAAPAPNAMPPFAPAGRVFAALRGSEQRQQALESRLRRIDGLGVNLRAGYDEVFGVSQRLPLFAFVSVQLAPGLLWQSSRDAESERAHQRRVERRIDEARRMLAELSERVARQLAIVDRRLGQLDEGIAWILSRHAQLEQVGTPAAREFMEDLWFEQVELEAEREYARALRHALLARHDDLAAGGFE